jgi:radical SAM protein with 4Fe4S-binding SPASM domain
MVTDVIAGAGRRLADLVRADFDRFLSHLTLPQPVEPGLYTYRLSLDGGQRRIHLRTEADGSGVLFVDVTDVIHLNPTATTMAKLALDGMPREIASARLASRIRPADRPRLTQELDQIFLMVDRFRQPQNGCPTCAVEGLERAPLFSRRARAPYKADLALTYGCNNQCAHCYNEPDRFAMPSLPLAHWRLVLDKLHEVGVPHIIFTGGEVTLHPELPGIIRYADDLGFVTGLNTNGRRIAHEPYMATLAGAGLNHVQVTLGSNRPEVHDAIMGAVSFEQTVRGITNAVRSRVHVITNTTLMRRNMDHVDEIIDFLHTLGIRTFAMNGMIYSGGGFVDPNAIPEEAMAPLLVRVRDQAIDKGMRFLWYTPTEYCRMSPVELELGAKRCNAGEYSICIEPNGDVLPCQSYYVSAGNILRDPWNQIWQGALFRTFRDRELDPVWAGLPEKCWHCPDLPLCGGGCRIEREAREGVRVAEQAVGGCSGCSPAGSRAGNPMSGTLQPQAGFIPAPSARNSPWRASGGQQGLISLDGIDVRTGPAAPPNGFNGHRRGEPQVGEGRTGTR